MATESVSTVKGVPLALITSRIASVIDKTKLSFLTPSVCSIWVFLQMIEKRKPSFPETSFRSDEGPTLEKSALKLFTVANLHYQLS